MNKKHSSARHQWNVHLRHWNCSIYEFFREFGYKKHSSVAASNLFLLCFPSLRPLVKGFYILGCNEASFGFCLSGLNPLSFDPASNNDPLQFNGSSGPLVTECPALETSTENTKKRKRANLPPGTDSKLTAVTLPHDAFSLVWYKRWP